MPKGGRAPNCPPNTRSLNLLMLDLLIPLRAIPYEDGTGKQIISIFPRDLLHPSSRNPEDRAGGKYYRSYIICKRSAVIDAVNTGQSSPFDLQ